MSLREMLILSGHITPIEAQTREELALTRARLRDAVSHHDTRAALAAVEARLREVEGAC